MNDTCSTDDLVEQNCGKVAILINGEIKEKVMSPADWKEKHGQGYTFIFHSKEGNIAFDDYSKFKSQVESDLPNSVLQEETHVS